MPKKEYRREDQYLCIEIQPYRVDPTYISSVSSRRYVSDRHQLDPLWLEDFLVPDIDHAPKHLRHTAVKASH